MKKTINVSLGGIVFNIEEDAHQKLSAYLDAISASMRGSEGHDEIMADIEARISELLQPKISDFKQVITISEVEEVINVMGSPEEFAPGHSETKKEDTYNMGGKGHAQYGRRRIFRDPDDKVLGGVCSGLAYHFGVDPIWLRLGFGLSLFLGGFGFFLYILLLIIIPKAQTAAEKLEMRGEPVDINNIRKVIEEDIHDFKEKAKSFGEDMKKWRTRSRTSSFERNISDFFSSVGTGIGGLIGGIFKVIFAFIGFVLILALTAMLIGLILSFCFGFNVVHIHTGSGHIMNYNVQNLFTMLDINGTEKTLLSIGLLLFIGVPIVGLIIRFGRAIMGIRQSPRFVSVLLFTAWFVGLVSLLTGAAFAAKHFTKYGSVKEETKLTVPSSVNTLYLKAMPADDEIGNVTIGVDSLQYYMTEDELFLGNTSLCIVASPDSSFHLVVNKSARGQTEAEAKESAAEIEYSFTQHDSILQFNPYYKISDGKPWRKQKVETTLEIPVNKTVDMPTGIDHIICSTIHHQHHHLGGHRWTISSSGLVEAK